MGCRFPQASTLEDYWHNILEQKSAISRVPKSRWNSELYFDPNPKTPDRTYSQIGAFITDYTFDPKAFRIPPSIASHVDPVQQIALSCAADALKDAGYLNNNNVNSSYAASRNKLICIGSCASLSVLSAIIDC